MRFKASIRNITTFTRLTASLNSLGKDVWLQLNNDQLRFTVVPEQGSQVWAVLAIDTIFETYTLQSASANNVINLRVPLAHLNRALRSALSANSASIRLTKKDNIPLLSLTIVTSSLSSALHAPTSIPTTTTATTANPTSETPNAENVPFPDNDDTPLPPPPPPPPAPHFPSDRETTITQDIPIVVLAPAEVSHIHEPVCPQPDVHIMLPPLSHLKNISDRFVKLAALGGGDATAASSTSASAAARLRIAATPTGRLRVGVATPALEIASTWSDLTNPELDPSQIEGGEEGVRTHASTVAKEAAARAQREARERGGVAEERWSEVIVEGRDWGRVLGVGRMGGRVIACFCGGVGLVLYVYLPEEEGEGGGSVLTFYIASYSE